MPDEDTIRRKLPADSVLLAREKSGAVREVLYNWDDWEAIKNGGEPAGSAA
jgi:hypothetical protein